MTEQEAIARGVIRWGKRYRFSEYVRLQAEVNGSLTDLGRELAVMNVTHIQLPSDR